MAVMRSPNNSPRRSSGSDPASSGAQAFPSAEGQFDPLTQPIHRNPKSFVNSGLEATDEDSTVHDDPDTDPYLLEINENGEIVDSAQPPEEIGVTEDMSTMAINPAQAIPNDLERFAEATAPATLHLNGDFAHMDDAAIMLELKAGNMAGFDFLIQKYRKPIINFMYRMTRNQAVAEELAQEVFLRVYRSRETYRAEARFSTWLYRIATNLGVNQARDTRHERAASTVYLDEPDSENGTTPDVADSTPDVEAKLLRNERMAAIREHVMALPERQKMAVLMHKYEGMDYSQIGEVLKLSESATKSLLFRAYQTLREKLKGFV